MFDNDLRVKLFWIKFENDFAVFEFELTAIRGFVIATRIFGLLR